MILPYQEIRQRLEDPEDSLDISPLTDDQIQPVSVDLRLGNQFITFPRENTTAIDPREDLTEYGTETTVEDSFIIQPGEFVLGETVERVRIPQDLVGFVHGRSSWARIAVQPHAAGLLDSGWEGWVTLEIVNLGPMPIHLVPDMRFCQITLETLTSPTESPYDGKYQDQRGVVPSRLEEDFTE